jgi:hypothetical protein
MGGSFCEKVRDRETLRSLHRAAGPRKRGLRDPFWKSGEANNSSIVEKFRLTVCKVNTGSKNPVPVNVSQIAPPFP